MRAQRHGGVKQVANISCITEDVTQCTEEAQRIIERLESKAFEDGLDDISVYVF